MPGLLHVYTGNGKGKTTAVVGLAVRCSGTGGKVVFAQFLKTSSTGELRSFQKLGIKVIRSALNLGWTYKMDAATKRKCRAEQGAILDQVSAVLQNDDIDLIVLDEVLDAVSTGMLDDAKLQAFLDNKPENTELAITGRPVPQWLADRCDYFSQIEKIKHPFDNGTPARSGIEN
ncbi:MAG: cob(I)yrinic acid a,c-diamide adenosyltransferase [Termitinemataceae bacterium]|nr:MAG: cob(I)yrinic acid a,c-diamide adenosyltransferase [Termitinemataceae bacterium]